MADEKTEKIEGAGANVYSCVLAGAPGLEGRPEVLVRADTPDEACSLYMRLEDIPEDDRKHVGVTRAG